VDTHILHSVNMAYPVSKQHSRSQTTKCFYLAQLCRQWYGVCNSVPMVVVNHALLFP